jgi:hypothetical protein
VIANRDGGCDQHGKCSVTSFAWHDRQFGCLSNTEQDGNRVYYQWIIAKSANPIFTGAATAEGVETTKQLETIRALGCVEMQGYLFSPPRPLAVLAPLLERQRRTLAKSA